MVKKQDMELGQTQQAQGVATNWLQQDIGVVCLCAAWCGVCREYEAPFKALQAQFPDIQFAWVDVEAHEDIVGDVDVETFPTLLIGCQNRALFLGPLLPQIKVLERLLAALQAQPQSPANLPIQAQALWERVVAQWHLASQ